MSEDKKVPEPASFEKVNALFHAIDSALGDALEEHQATPYEVELALACLSYKLKTHEMTAFFEQCVQAVVDKEKQDDEKKHHEQYR